MHWDLKVDVGGFLWPLHPEEMRLGEESHCKGPENLFAELAPLSSFEWNPFAYPIWAQHSFFWGWKFDNFCLNHGDSYFSSMFKPKQKLRWWDGDWNIKIGTKKEVCIPFTMKCTWKILLQVGEGISHLIMHYLGQLKPNLFNKKFT